MIISQSISAAWSSSSSQTSLNGLKGQTSKLALKVQPINYSK